MAAKGAVGMGHGVRVVCGFLHRGEFSDSDHFFTGLSICEPINRIFLTVVYIAFTVTDGMLEEEVVP